MVPGLSLSIGGPKERGNVEAWYDAEEDLGPAGRGLKEERLRKVIESERNGESKFVSVGPIWSRFSSSHSWFFILLQWEMIMMMMMAGR